MTVDTDTLIRLLREVANEDPTSASEAFRSLAASLDCEDPQYEPCVVCHGKGQWTVYSHKVGRKNKVEECETCNGTGRRRVFR